MTQERFYQANEFLKLLDPNTTQFTFQTFDNTDNRNPSLIHIFHGSLSQHWERLCQLNEQGAGIYVTINRTDLKGRKTKNITHIRSVFFENDDGVNPSKVPFDMSMVVKTSQGRGHMYYLLDDAIRINEESSKQFRNIMEYMISLGSDKNVKDLARVLRLPGFYNHSHGKKELVELKLTTKYRHTWEQLCSVCKSKQEADVLEQLNVGDTKKIVEIALIYSALQAIDPDESYETWLKIGMALHHESGGGSEGLELFHKWSIKGAKYQQGDCSKKWKTFEQKADSEHDITIRTLFNVAYNSGWSGSYSLHERYINLERHRKLDLINQQYAVIYMGDGVRIVHRGYSSIRQWTTKFFTKQDFELKLKNQFLPYVVWSNHATPRQLLKIKPAATVWLEWSKRREYKGVVFNPDNKIQLSNVPQQLPNTKFYNLYLGLANPGKPGTWPMIKDHIYEIWCKKDKAAFEYVINWLCNMFQNPGSRGHTCLVLKSDKQGAGKNIITDIITEAFGEHGVSVSSNIGLTGNFNALYAKSICFVASEAVWAGSNKARNMLKGYITDSQIECEEKFHPRYIVKNCSHLIFLSNEEWNAPVELGDRRYFVLDVSNKYVKNYEYFDQLAHCIKQGEGDAFIHFLRTHNLNGFKPQRMPQVISEAKIDNIMHGLGSVEAYIMSALHEGTFINILGEYSDEPVETEVTYTNKQLYTAYSEYVKSATGMRYTLQSKVHFFRRFRKFFGSDGIYPARPTIEGKQQRGFKLAPMSDLRKIAENVVGGSIEWLN